MNDPYKNNALKEDESLNATYDSIDVGNRDIL